MKNKSTLVTKSAMIAALYVLLTMVSKIFGLDSGVIQVRFSEALCILPCFTPTAIFGLFIGCMLSNIFAGAVVWDVIFGSIATLIGAIGVYLLRKNKILALVCPVVSNAVIIPFVLTYAYGLTDGIWYFVLTVGIGQIISCTVLGYFLGKAVDKRKKWLFRQ